MKILIEGENYSLDILQNIFNDQKFYIENNQEGIISYVGYYHSYKKGEIVYMLPKVFMIDHYQTVFGINKYDLINLKNEDPTFKHEQKYSWIRQISFYFFSSLKEYKKRNYFSNILQKNLTPNLNSNIGNYEYTYIDLLLSFLKFYKKNKNHLLYRYIESKTHHTKNTQWEKTVRKNIPLIRKNQPIYINYRNKKKTVNTEEELLLYFFSILNHFNDEHKLFLDINKSFKVIKGAKFRALQKTGRSKLKKIKYKYFSDVLKKMYRLCDIYFNLMDKRSRYHEHEEYITFNNYNIVFEDMIDKLFSDNFSNQAEDIPSLKDLKYNYDGKIIDHIFDYKSLIDSSDIFYIGDSKYYKSGNNPNKLSKYKQFTYAKNIIQYNIDFLNKTGDYYTKNIRYRDEITEGYNVTPNFFIFGYINNYKDFKNDNLQEKGSVIKSFHYEKRLFDRDTLFINQYKINFLYVLKAYTHQDNLTKKNFKLKVKNQFRNNFISFFSDPQKCQYEFFIYKYSNIHEFINNNFRTLIGKTFITNEKNLILAKHIKDDSLNHLLKNFNNYKIQ
ncbi:MAG: hypothetical protein ACQEQE_09980 [Bacillota bacterium]